MFEEFQNAFVADLYRLPNEVNRAELSGLVSLDELIIQFGGCSFRDGSYKIFRASDLAAWNTIISETFPTFRNRIKCFGYDWLGRVFGVDRERVEDGEPGVAMFEPGTGQVLEVPANIGSFHNNELVQYPSSAIAIEFYEIWLTSGGERPGYSDCVGYKIPLFLGGSDEVENLALSNLDVYWELMKQLIIKARGLPQGTLLRTDRLLDS